LASLNRLGFGGLRSVKPGIQPWVFGPFLPRKKDNVAYGFKPLSKPGGQDVERFYRPPGLEPSGREPQQAYLGIRCKNPRKSAQSASDHTVLRCLV
jgi:hypothetical protein